MEALRLPSQKEVSAAKERLTKWWNGEDLGRPALDLTALRPSKERMELPAPPGVAYRLLQEGPRVPNKAIAQKRQRRHVPRRGISPRSAGPRPVKPRLVYLFADRRVSGQRLD